VRDNSLKAPRQLGFAFVARCYDIVSLLLRLLPVDAASALGGAVVRALGPLTPKHAIVMRNLELAFPELELQQRRRLARSCWEQMGRTFVEFPLMDRITPASGRVQVVGLERLTALGSSGKAAVLVSGHLSNWETMMAAIVHSGLNCRVSYRPSNNPYMDRRIVESRRRYGVRLEAAKGGEGTRELLSHLNGGGAVALLNDQRDNWGVEAPFFGRMVRAAPGPARLALKCGMLIPMSVGRTSGARFVVTIHEPIPIERTGERSRDLASVVAKINAFIEARLRERPAEWLWAHRRWPVELYASQPLED
jgi:KDO2-lipid IV(A) lauroyltransferase